MDKCQQLLSSGLSGGLLRYVYEICKAMTRGVMNECMSGKMKVAQYINGESFIIMKN